MRAIDLFAGAGGFSTGAAMAGCNVVWAANHWQVAVDFHAANHPRALHQCQDLHQADWSRVPEHDIFLASPCCHGHSNARGKVKNNPQHDASRSTAWAVISAEEYHGAPCGVVENVPAFLQWALYPAWAAAMNALGYQLAPHIVDCADFGVPQHRERLFIVCTKSKAPLQIEFEKREHVAASSFVDFDSGKWSLINRRGRAEATLRRVGRGREQFGSRFVMPFYGSGSGLTGRSLQRPVGTITTRDRWAVVDGDRMRMFTKDECRAGMAFPPDYHLPADHRTAVHLLGNAVPPPVARDFIDAIRKSA